MEHIKVKVNVRIRHIAKIFDGAVHTKYSHHESNRRQNQTLHVNNSCPGIAPNSMLHQDNVIWGNLCLKVRNITTRNNLFVVLKVCTLNFYNFSICADIY